MGARWRKWGYGERVGKDDGEEYSVWESGEGGIGSGIIWAECDWVRKNGIAELDGKSKN